MFVIMAPLFGLLVDQMRSVRVAWVIIGLLFAQSFIYLLYGTPRTLIGGQTIFNTSRDDQYFCKRPDLRLSYQRAAKMIGEPHSHFVALACKGDSWEYAIRSQLPKGIGILHVGVSNPSGACPAVFNFGRPEFLIQLGDASVPADYADYQKVFQEPGIMVFIRSTTIP